MRTSSLLSHITILSFIPLTNGCGAPAEEAPSDEQTTTTKEALVGTGQHGFMIVSDRDPGLAINAYGGAQNGTVLKLYKGCTWENSDCTWQYSDGMLISDTNPNLAINAYGGAQQGTVLKLSNACTKTNPDCTWTYKNGVFVSDNNPSVGINAWGGAAPLGDVKLNNVCIPGEKNLDCKWTLQGAMIHTHGFDLNAYGGAADGTVIKLNNACSRTNFDCTWTIHNGMIMSDRDPNLSINAYGGAAFGTTLKLNKACKANNTDCTWTMKKGMILSDTNSSLAMNDFGGAVQAAPIKLHNACTASNPDCNFALQIGGAQCGRYWQAPCAGNVCYNGGTLVKDQCRPVVTKVFNCGSLNTGDVYGWAELGISNNGDWSFVGHSQTGQWWTWNYGWGISLTATDSQGRHFSFAHNGTLHGKGTLTGSASEDFGDSGHDPSLIPYWDSIAAPNSLTSTTESPPTNYHFGCNLHASQNALDVGLDLLVDLGLVAGTGGAILLAGLGGSGQGCWNSAAGQYEDPCGQAPAQTNEDF